MSDVIITRVGLSKIAGATANNPLILEKFAVGDGIGAGEDSTALINEKYRDLINDKYSNNNNLVVECVLRGNAEISEGFYLRELGIFDVDGDLIAIVKLPESYRPPLLMGQILTENIFNVTLKIENTENIQISINENIFATTDEVDRLENKVDNLSSLDIHVKNANNFPTNKNVQEAMDSLYLETQNLLNMNRNFYKMFIGVAMTQFNDVNPLMNNELIKWSWCEGQTLSVAEYPELYKVLGNRWGGTANVDFKLPDSRNRVIRNIGNDMGLGYQEDALQEIVGRFVLLETGSWESSGAFTNLKASGGNEYFYHNSNKSPWIHHADMEFRASRVARTSHETRVKSLSGKTFMITKVLI